MILTVNNYKIEKTNKLHKKYLTAILHLSPYKASGYNTCQHATPGCSTSCLFTAGFGRYTKVREARNKKTKLFFENRQFFKEQLEKSITYFVNKATREGKKPVVRLNGTSDLPWEKLAPELFSKYPNVQFYDYCKSFNRMRLFLEGKLPPNYHLTFSRSEYNWEQCEEILRLGGNVAVVFAKMPRQYKGYKVWNGDKHDLRFLDKRGIIGLLPKGKAKQDTTGFVVR